MCGEAAAAPRQLHASVHSGVMGFIWKKQCFVLDPKASGCFGNSRLPSLPVGHPPRMNHTMYDFRAQQAVPCRLCWWNADPWGWLWCPRCSVLSALTQLHFWLDGTFQHKVPQTEQIKVETCKISKYLWNSWMPSFTEHQMVKVILIPLS